jgi:hypothetical protein
MLATSRVKTLKRATYNLNILVQIYQQGIALQKQPLLTIKGIGQE